MGTSDDSGGFLWRALWTRWARQPGSVDARGRTDEERTYYALTEGVYARFARAYDVAVWPMKRLRRDVVEVSRAGNDARVLDVATGTGAQARAFAAKCREVVGIDLSDAMLQVARAKSALPNLSYAWADATDLPFEDATFDVATMSFALHEMPASIREAVLEQMVRVTKPKGSLIVVDYGLPRCLLGRLAVYRIVRFYEDAHYGEFIRLDVRGLLERKGIDVFDDRSALAGAVRILAGAKSSAERMQQT